MTDGYLLNLRTFREVRYGATMSRDGETWECGYDCMFGAGFDDIH